MPLFLCLKNNNKNQATQMNPREKLLGMGRLYLLRGEPVPLDILARAEAEGLSIEDFGEPINQVNDEGEITNGE